MHTVQGLSAHVAHLSGRHWERGHRRLVQCNGATAAHTNQEVDTAMNAVVNSMTPYKALVRIKRWLRRKFRKPADITIRQFYGHVRPT